MLDEPFSRLDAALRAAFRRWVFEELARQAIPAILVIAGMAWRASSSNTQRRNAARRAASRRLKGSSSSSASGRASTVEQALSRAGLHGFAARDPATLSGGQRARVSLLRFLKYPAAERGAQGGIQAAEGFIQQQRLGARQQGVASPRATRPRSPADSGRG
jgi:ABC-type uncharacterized transport system YnjBCD ATPase subunit